MNEESIINLTEPTGRRGAATKGYIDCEIAIKDLSSYLKNKNGSVVMTGAFDMGNNTLIDVGYIETRTDFRSHIEMNDTRIFDLPDPTGPQTTS